MSSFPTQLIRFGLILLTSSAAVACDYEGPGPDPVEGPGPDPMSIALSIDTAGATLVEGGSQPVRATLTRIGGFSGNVNIFVTGQPAGVTASVSDMQTSGAVTTATVSIAVGAGVTPDVYLLLVHGTGNGVNAVTQAFTLTVGLDLGFSISLPDSALSIEQGGGALTTTVKVSRVSHLGAVQLAVTGLPSGVTAAFDFSAPGLSGNSSVLTLTVDPTTPAGIYHLQVKASDPEREGFVSTPLTLTVTSPPGYSFSAPPTLSVTQGDSGPLIPVYLIRSSFTGSVTLSIQNLPAGVGAFIYPENPVPGSSTSIFLWAAGSAVPGTYSNLLLRGVAPGLSDVTAPLTLTIRVAPFALTLSQETLIITPGAAPLSVTVNLVRSSFSGLVTLHVDLGDEEGSMPPGVTAAFSPNLTAANSSQLTFTAAAAATPGSYDLYVWGEAQSGYFWYVPLTLIVTSGGGG